MKPQKINLREGIYMMKLFNEIASSQTLRNDKQMIINIK